jgi:hypothetical protein
VRALGHQRRIIGGVAAWSGGELVDRLGIGVDEDAHADAPSSLATRRPDETSIGDKS